MDDDRSQMVPAHITGLVRLLASESEQMRYQAEVPHVNVTTELVCLWFDDLYHADTSAFREGFSAKERTALAAFHDLYAQRVGHLPDGELSDWLKNSHWHEAMRAATMLYATLQVTTPQNATGLGEANADA